MKYIRTNSLKRLFSLKRRGFEEEAASPDVSFSGEENNESFKGLDVTQPSQRPAWKCFSFEEISDATNYFSSGFASQPCECFLFLFSFGAFWADFILPKVQIFGCGLAENFVGKGGYAEVYRGVLRNGDEIAVKRLTKVATDERKEKEFLTEIGTVGHVCHPNVLSLLGCCIDSGLYLIFQFSSKGSVASLLHGTQFRAYVEDKNTTLVFFFFRLRAAYLQLKICVFVSGFHSFLFFPFSFFN